MYSKGISWINDCRIPTSSDDIEISKNKRNKSSLGSIQNKWETESLKAIESTFDLTKGRFPANILVSDDMLNDGKKYGNLFNTNRNKDVDGGTGNSLVRAHKQGESNGICDNGISSSRFYDIDKWFDNLLE